MIFSLSTMVSLASFASSSSRRPSLFFSFFLVLPNCRHISSLSFASVYPVKPTPPVAFQKRVQPRRLQNILLPSTKASTPPFSLYSTTASNNSNDIHQINRKKKMDDHTSAIKRAPTSWDDAKHMAVIPHCIVPLSHNSHKGSSGRVGVLGGSARYTGAPYYAATAALHVGADLAYIFCADEAALPIKCYSPELMVIPVYPANEFDQLLVGSNEQQEPQSKERAEFLIQRMVQEVVSMMDRLHVLVIGPGLGRCPLVMQAVARIIREARHRQLALVLDADALFLLTLPEYQTLLQGYSKAILTPNAVEYQRLLQAAGSNNSDDHNDRDDDTTARLQQSFDQAIVVVKGRHDQVIRLTQEDHDVDNDETQCRRRLICTEEGGLKRSGGIGDVLSGTLGTLVSWHEILQKQPPPQQPAKPISSNISKSPVTTHLDESSTDWLLWSCWTACCITKRATKRAFDRKKRAMTAPDILQEIGPTVEDMTATL